ncbi:TetR/AcrR family transcriptional regulator [Saccharibacillus sp. O23]|uniref:TetR/AcrR family transcriptional regulator n=1 Tax=Saccharibacillus sp. O23 TaxID=2009338 RepID=UPI00211B0F9D|nr:TetR/AcrR family transcriptional regulator [Saccharibacillus sp. O23]
MRPRAFDEEQALDAAMRVFWEKGYEAASLTELTQRMDIRKPSLYATFGDKRELFERALKRYTERHAAYVEQVLEREDQTIPAFAGLLRDTAAGGSGGDPALGCLAVLTLDELGAAEPDLAAQALDHQLRLAALFRRKIEKGIGSGELSRELDAEASAGAVLVSLIGLTVMLKAKPPSAFIDAAIATTLTLLKEEKR